jgi:chromosome segregation ATPase
MAIFSSPTGFLEVLFFLCAVAAFVAAVRFFMDSRRRLNEAFPGLSGTRRLLSIGIDRNGFLVPKDNKHSRSETRYTTPLSTIPSSDKTREELADLRRQLQQQKTELAQVLQTLSAGGQPVLPQASTHLSMEAQHQLQDLQVRLAAKEKEVQQLRHHEAYSNKLQQQFEEVQLAFDDLHEKMLQMERHARQTAELSNQLEQAKQSSRQMETAVQQRDEKLQLLMVENSRLREACGELETKLTEANLQQQQLVRKAHLLEGLNTDIVEMAEAARKLKSGMAKAAEMESLLQLMIAGEQKEK